MNVRSFLNELRNIAVNSALVSSTTMSRLKRGNVLLGIQRKPKQATSKEAELDDEDDWELQYDLKRPEEIVVADDSIALQIFGDKLFTAPQEDILESESLSITLGQLALIKAQSSTATLARVA